MGVRASVYLWYYSTFAAPLRRHIYILTLFQPNPASGAQRAYLKARQHHCQRMKGTSLSLEEHSRYREATNKPLFSSTTNAACVTVEPGAVKPRLLDVGSCYNPFKFSKHANMFDVTGTVRR